MVKEEWRKWKHITKLDPDRKITPSIIETIIETNTDAIMVSGTLGVTRDKVKDLLKMLKDYKIPKILEPAAPTAMVYRDVDWIFVPSVFNTRFFKYINGLHKLWVKMDKNINWDIVVPEAYIILNPKCSAARLTKAYPLTKEGTVAAAVCAEKFFKFPIVYIEYSGTYGDPGIVKAVSENLSSAHLIYGGGINTKERAEEMSRYATIVVGNTIYENGAGSFVNTMRGTLLQELKNIQDRLGKLKKIKPEQGKEKKDKKEAKEEAEKEAKEEEKIKKFCERCNREIKHKGRCLPCNYFYKHKKYYPGLEENPDYDSKHEIDPNIVKNIIEKSKLKKKDKEKKPFLHIQMPPFLKKDKNEK